MNVNLLSKLLIICGITFVATYIASAQDGAQTRSITSDDFASQRPPAAKGSGNKGHAGAPKRVTYKYVRRDATRVRWRNAPKNPTHTAVVPKGPAKVWDIGITIWKLRPSGQSDNAFKLPVRINGQPEMWTAERVRADSPFEEGDRVRLAVESSVSGYLYVVNSAMYDDGNGDPRLIFPANLGDNNAIRPGMLVDFPDQTEQWPYFIMKAKKADYRGELLTVIISPTPISNIETDKSGKILNPDDVFDLNANGVVEIFNRTDMMESVYTKAEAESACGSKARQAEGTRGTTQQPCGPKSRDLTREEPLPQSIYRVTGVAGQPASASVRLSVGTSN